MAKTNFFKVEESLKAGLDKMSIENLGKLADVAQRASRPELRMMMEKAVKAAAKASLEKKGILYIIRQALKDQSLEEEFYVFIGLPRSDLLSLVGRFKELTVEEWKKLSDIKGKIVLYKQEILKQHPEKSDEELIKAERKRHINKRFNVREKWLPIK